MGDYYVPGGVDFFRMIRLIVGYRVSAVLLCLP